MHPEAALEEDSTVFGDGWRSSEEVFQDGGATALRMHPLGHLSQLERIAQENYVASRGPHGQRVREGYLTRLVDHQMVERPIQLAPREEPGASRDQLDLSTRMAGLRGVGFTRDERPLVHRLLVPRGRLLQ